ncbi:MAG: hypothetical protein EOP10_11975 [Proteobacteria bacterium]|nr:MAG: hypothetical protein EOP10_11975 [Pseudomonadota bacterium]
MKNLLRLLAFCAAMVSGSPSSFALDQATYELTYASPDCGNFKHYSPAVGQENQLSLVMEFFDFEVSTSPFQSEVSRRCDLDVYVNVPKGMSFRLHKAVADGEYQYSPEGSVGVSLTYRYSFDEESDPAYGLGSSGGMYQNAAYGSANPGAYIAEAVGGSDWEYTHCKDHDQRIHMGGMFELTASRGDYESQQSDIAMFNSEAIAGPQRPHKTLWQWEWKPCAGANPWLGKSFRSRYTSSDGRWVFGYTGFSGPSGYYRLDTGESGWFSNVSYADDYSWAQGIWSFQDGSSGWFRFYLKDEDEFSGDYGYGFDYAEPAAGQWKGYVE